MFTTRASRLGGAALVGCALVVYACSGGGSRQGKIVSANPESGELMDRAYAYLVKGDADFLRLAPNYSTLRPFSRDTSMVVETESQHRGKTPPPTDFVEFFHVRLNKPMLIRLIIADTTGNGLITYEYPELAVGNYTIGSKGWPIPQIDRTKGLPWVYAYWVGDQRFRARFQFKLDKDRHFVPMPGVEPVM